LLLALSLIVTPLVCDAQERTAPPRSALAAIEAKLKRGKDANLGNIPERRCTNEAGKSVDEVINKRYGQIVAKLKARDARGIIARTRKS
jgi:uncharacterized protein YecT (DUF1311 family)